MRFSKSLNDLVTDIITGSIFIWFHTFRGHSLKLVIRSLDWNEELVECSTFEREVDI